MNKKLGILLIGGMLVLAACGEEDAQPAGNEPVEEEMETSEEVVEEEVVEEEATEEEPMTDAAEAAKGEASPLLSKADMTSFVFNEAGEFNVYCEPHPVMKMKVIVEEGATTSGDVALDLADYAFSEESITVAPGTVITWTDQDSAQHNVAFE
ncbi:plastocyanin/azurin family copper-binding protein [Paenisporosarcina sp. OV554]|uniref:plastocyanin/azurin family copper-binding protein n=1 Tax=Paenisporosarcina sp. OV554 TaxID=2135694 RepID=UPI000D344587|nr:plastocyanin/azurin family copper-binding protein [Paenisporosarcina sp. OV554]PUB16788.1 copper binding plastocyanin/azurin family protein [Paenisporosarcina sp. OV554]